MIPEKLRELVSAERTTMQGSLTEFTLAQVLQFVALAERTGVITVRSKDYEVRLLVEGDRVVGWGSEDYDAQEPLLAIVRLPAALHESIGSISRKEDTPGLSFILRNLVEPDRWEAFTRRVLEQNVYPLLNADEGEFDVQVTRCPPAPLRVSMSSNSIILDGSRWESEMEAARHDGFSRESVWQRANGNELPERVTLSRIELLVWSQLGSPHSIGEVSALLCIPDLDTVGAIKRLLTAAMIEEVELSRSTTSEQLERTLSTIP